MQMSEYVGVRVSWTINEVKETIHSFVALNVDHGQQNAVSAALVTVAVKNLQTARRFCQRVSGRYFDLPFRAGWGADRPLTTDH